MRQSIFYWEVIFAVTWGWHIMLLGRLSLEDFRRLEVSLPEPQNYKGSIMENPGKTKGWVGALQTEGAWSRASTAPHRKEEIEIVQAFDQDDSWALHLEAFWHI